MRRREDGVPVFPLVASDFKQPRALERRANAQRGSASDSAAASSSRIRHITSRTPSLCDIQLHMAAGRRISFTAPSMR
jgi:hypothetical protein